MSNYHTTLMKIADSKYQKCFTELTDQEQSDVLEIYYDYY